MTEKKIDKTDKTVAIFCGFFDEDESSFRAMAEDIGKLLAACGYFVLLGGKKKGISEWIAESVSRNGGKLHFFIPIYWREEIDPKDRSEYTICGNLGDRNRLFSQNADIFLVLPGTYGALDQFFHIMAQKGAGEIKKQVILCNMGGFFTELIKFLESAFSKVHYDDLADGEYHIANNVEELAVILSKL